MNQRRVFATFVPEAWVNDQAIEIDGKYEFEITDQVLRLGREASLAIRDNRDSSDALWESRQSERHGETIHSGPFHVKCEEAIRAFWED
jgi:hypothetical protein